MYIIKLCKWGAIIVTIFCLCKCVFQHRAFNLEILIKWMPLKSSHNDLWKLKDSIFKVKMYIIYGVLMKFQKGKV